MTRGAKSFCGGGVAITFDDGPDPDVTPRILQVLAAAGACATFFVIGRRVSEHPALVRDMLAGGHALGNHTQTHRNLLLCTPWRARREIAGCQASVADATGVLPAVFRAPWAKVTSAARRACCEMGLTVYDWTVAPEGWPRPATVDEMVDTTLRAARPGAIIDLHDVPWHNDAGARSIAALPRILDGLAERDLRTVLLPEAVGLGEGT